MGPSKIVKSDLDGTNMEDVITADLNNPWGIALDVAGGKMYWTEQFPSNKIRRANLDGTNLETVVTGGQLSNPAGIALDLTNNHIYVANTSGSRILQYNLDGTNGPNFLFQTLPSVQPWDVAIDLTNKKVYWTDQNGRKIERADLPSGSNKETVVDLSAVEGDNRIRSVALDVPKGKMYWTNVGGNKIQSANLDGTNQMDLITSELRTPQEIVVCSSCPAANCAPPCAITAATPSTPTCSGNNATFEVSFTTANGPDGDLEVVEQTTVPALNSAALTVLGSGSTSPIKVTINGPTSTGNKTYILRFKNDNNCSRTFTVNLPECPTPCSFTSATPTTPTCDGTNASFEVNFATANGPGGTIEIVETPTTAPLFNGSTTVLGSGTTSPIKVTIPGPTTQGSKNYTIRFANNNSCSTTFDVDLPTCRPALTIKSANELMFGDPCSCTDPRNCDINGVTYFHDTLTVTPTGAGASGLTIQAVAGATNFFTAVPCFGGGASPTLIAAGTTIPETAVGSGVYKIEFWRPSGVIPTLSVMESGVITAVPANTFQPVCTTEACNPSAPIPTMSQWGLMIFGLMLLNLSIFLIQRRDKVIT